MAFSLPSKTGVMGGAFLPAAQVKQTGDLAQEAEIPIPGDATIGSLLVPIQQATYTFNKGSAAAITLLAPTLAQSGTVLNLTSGSAFAHVVTGTALINDGVTGQPHTTLTFAAFAGASITLVASKQLWNVLGKNLVTVT
jgi:hypothetical protein